MLLSLGLITFGSLILSSGDQGQANNQRIISSSKIINENEMINMLSAGLMNPEVIILREFKNKGIGSHSRHTYQTLCLAKEKNKANAPKICLINNLAQFLTKL